MVKWVFFVKNGWESLGIYGKVHIGMVLYMEKPWNMQEIAYKEAEGMSHLDAVGS
jgi:hypothetical protein